MREHTEALRPPRALWVPFMLGRPFGVPDDPGFQRRVLLAALRLFERPSGPVLEDFPEDAPFADLGAPPEGLACPVSFPGPVAGGSLAQRLLQEIGQLEAWHAVAVSHRGRTTAGVTGMPIDRLAAWIGGWLAGSAGPWQAGLAPADAVKRAADELKAWYHESKSMQPGRHPPAELEHWFWFETAAGETLLAVRERAAALQGTDPSFTQLATLSLVPRAVDMAKARRA